MGSTLHERTREIEGLTAAVRAGHATVAWVGPVGVGKTHALEGAIARGALGVSVSVALVDLRSVASHEAMLWAMTDAADVGVTGPIDAAVDAMLHEPCPRLFVLDAAERLTPESESAFESWARTTTHTRFLFVSRRELPWVEKTCWLRPLSLPTDASDGEAYGLLVRSVRASRPDFEPTEEERATLRRAVTRLDGLPSTITRAAARLRWMAPRALEELLGRPEGLWEVLAARAPADDLRHPLDAIWEALSPVDREVLTQLTVFDGPFDVSAAEAVLELPQEQSLIGSLTRLSERSLLVSQPETANLPAGLRLLAPFAAHFASKLASEDAAALHRRHARYLANAARAALDALSTGDARRGAVWLSSHADALEAAFFDGALEDLAPRLALAVDEALKRRGYPKRRLRALERASDLGVFGGPGEPEWGGLVRRSEALLGLDRLDDALAALDEASARRAARSSRRARATIGALRATVLFAAGKNAEARAVAEEAIEHAQSCEDPRLEARGRMELTKYFLALHQPEALLAESSAALELYQRVQDGSGASYARRAVSGALLSLNRPTEAISMLEQAIADAQASGDDASLARASANLATARAMAGVSQGDALFETARRALLRHGSTGERCLNDLNHAYALVDEGRLAEAKRRLPALRGPVSIGARPLAVFLDALDVWIALLEGRDHEAVQRSQALLGAGDSSGSARRESVRIRIVAALSRTRLDSAGAQALLAEARSVSPVAQRQFAGIDRLVRALITLHVASSQDRGRGDRTGAGRRAVLAAMQECSDAVDELERAEAKRSLDARFSARVARQQMLRVGRFARASNVPAPPARAPGPVGPIWIDPTASWIELGDSHLDLSRRAPLRAIVASLAEARLDGGLASRETLIEAGWPNEKMVGRSASSRLHVAISSLRKLGMRDYLLAEGGAYGFRGDVSLLWLVNSGEDDEPADTERA